MNIDIKAIQIKAENNHAEIATFLKQYGFLYPDHSNFREYNYIVVFLNPKEPVGGNHDVSYINMWPILDFETAKSFIMNNFQQKPKPELMAKIGEVLVCKRTGYNLMLVQVAYEKVKLILLGEGNRYSDTNFFNSEIHKKGVPISKLNQDTGLDLAVKPKF